MDKKKYHFSGWATRNNIKCSDGRTIKKDAFKNSDGLKVPLVWNHNHKDADNVLGHVLLENRDEGVYAYGLFNETEQGNNAKELVKHGDVTSLSIYANKLKQSGGDVIHGIIREVSLVLAGANPGAYIETVMIHSEEGEEEATIYNPSESLELAHEDQDDVQQDEYLVVAPEPEKTEENNQQEPDKNVEHSINNMEDLTMAEQPKEKTVQDVFDELTEEQKNVVYALIGQALEEKNNTEGNSMKQNAFDTKDVDDENTLYVHLSEEGKAFCIVEFSMK